MSTIEERRAGMIGSVTGGYRGTLASAERYRSRILQELPDIPYFTLQEQQEFIRTNGGNWDGESFCGTTEGYQDGNCTINSLEKIQNSRAVSNVPLLIPKKADGQEWTPIQLEALARQSIKVTKRASKDYTNFRGTKKYKQNVVYYVYDDPPNYYQKYTQNGVPPIIYDDPQQKPLVTSVVLPDPSTSSGYRGNTLKYGKQEPEVVIDRIEPLEITPSSTQKKPESVFQPVEPEPQVTTDHIEPPVEAEPEKLYEVYGQTLPLSESAVDYYESLGVAVTTSQIEPPGVEEPQVTTSQVEPPGGEEPCPDWVRDHPELSCPTEVTTDRVDPPPLVEEIIDVYPQEVTAEISWFGDTWFPWHLELEDRRRR